MNSGRSYFITAVGNVRQKGEEGTIELGKWADVVVGWSLLSHILSEIKVSKKLG